MILSRLVIRARANTGRVGGATQTIVPSNLRSTGVVEWASESARVGIYGCAVDCCTTCVQGAVRRGTTTFVNDGELDTFTEASIRERT